MQSNKVCLAIKLKDGKFWVAETGNRKGYENSLREGTCTNAYIKKYGFDSILEASSKPCKGLVIKLMHKHGLENVRGTCYKKEVLTQEERKEVLSLLTRYTEEVAVETASGPVIPKNTEQQQSTVVNIFFNEQIKQDSPLLISQNVAQFMEGISTPNVNKNTPMKAPKENPLASILKCPKKTLYILQLKHGHYYVGTTTKNLEDRINEHRNGKGAWYTQAYPVKECIYNSPTMTNFDEDNMTEALMFALGSSGVQKVRGGSYSQLVLSNAQLETLQRKFDHLRNACLSCGERGHYISECPHPDGELCGRCHCRGHNEVVCTNRYYKDGKQIF